MKLPNGYGTIGKETRGRRRKRYYAKLPAVYELIDGKAKCIRKTLGWYKTRKEALEALAEYHKDPEYYNGTTQTLSDMWNIWLMEQTLSVRSVTGYKIAWGHMEPLHQISLSDLNYNNIGDVIAKLSPSVQKQSRTVLNKLFDIAIRRELIFKNPMSAIKAPQIEKQIIRKLWTPAEIHFLWENASDPRAAYLLILLYSGMRAMEPFTVSEEKQGYIIAGSKTKAGKRRIIPIHSVVQNLWKTFKEQSAGIRADTYYERIRQASVFMQGHTVHDTRYTFISRMSELCVPELVVQKIVGHAHNSITSDLYTIKEAPELCWYVEKLYYADNCADNVRTTGEDN